MRLQFFKCAFCERPLAREFAGLIEHDVEHFRPKGPIKAWPTARQRKTLTYDFETGTASPAGYHWLAYDIENYAAACKPCNTIRKSNYFPIERSRGLSNADIRSLNRSEHPLLIYPIGLIDDDPYNLITFEGIVAKPRYKRGRKYRRARVTIDFFALNQREELWADRFRSINQLFLAMEVANSNGSAKIREAAQRTVDGLLSNAAPQSGCARAFYATMISDPEKAWTFYQMAEERLGSKKTQTEP